MAWFSGKEVARVSRIAFLKLLTSPLFDLVIWIVCCSICGEDGRDGRGGDERVCNGCAGG